MTLRPIVSHLVYLFESFPKVLRQNLLIRSVGHADTRSGNQPTALAFGPWRADNGVVFLAGDSREEYHTGSERNAPTGRTTCKGCAAGVFFEL